VSSSPDVLLTSALVAAVKGSGGDLEDLFTEDVTAWSPNLFVTSRSELAAEWATRDETFSAPEIIITSLDMVGTKAIAEWLVEADHTGPFQIAGDVVAEPTGRRLVLAGVTVAETRGGRISALRTYFDDAALLEQILVTD
jgi:ketosteroid isomerase-like protein